MALIKCTGCGHEISDKASTCPYCGNPVSPKDGNVCKECGIQLSVNADVCPNCGCPTSHVVILYQEANEEEPEKKKWWIWALAIALFCLIGGWAYYGFIYQSQEETKEPVIEEKKDSVGVEEEVREDLVELTRTFLNAIEKYNQLGMFSEGYAAVLKNEEWGYINTKGEEVIPAAINAACVGRFSEGMAFVLGKDYSDFRIINTEGKTVFKGKCSFDCMQYDSEQMPYFKNGKIYVDKILNNQYKCEIYDKLGKKTGTVDWEEGERFYKEGNGEYTIFKNTQNDEVGLKDPSGNIVLSAEYSSINGLSKGKTDFNNGVVLAVLCEVDVDEEDYNDYGGILREGSRYFYGYADLKGNDTFTAEQKRRCRQSKSRTENTNDYDFNTANYEDYESESSASSTPQWVQGTWTHDVTAPMVGVVASYRVEISGNTLTFYRNGEFQYCDNITCQNGRIVGNHGSFVLKESVQRLADETGTYNKVDGSGSNGSSSTRFSTAYDVIGYLSGRTFREISSGGVLQIRQEGVYVNGQCMTGAPSVSSFSSTSAVVRASLIPSGTIIFHVDAQNGTITDSSGFTYR